MSSAPVSVMWCSFGVSCALGEGGARAVNEREVKGNVEALGFPARREMTPGVCSRGKRPRTGYDGCARYGFRRRMEEGGVRMLGWCLFG